MKRDERQEVDPLDESIVLWQELARTGSGDKGSVVNSLYRQGVLSKSVYKHGCPLCEAYRHAEINCYDCPWPGLRHISVRCIGPASSYERWEWAPDNPSRRKQALRVLALLRYRRDRRFEQAHPKKQFDEELNRKIEKAVAMKASDFPTNGQIAEMIRQQVDIQLKEKLPTQTKLTPWWDRVSFEERVKTFPKAWSNPPNVPGENEPRAYAPWCAEEKEMLNHTFDAFVADTARTHGRSAPAIISGLWRLHVLGYSRSKRPKCGTRLPYFKEESP